MTKPTMASDEKIATDAEVEIERLIVLGQEPDEFGFERRMAILARLAAAPVVPAPSDAPRLARQGGLTEELIQTVRVVVGFIEQLTADHKHDTSNGHCEDCRAHSALLNMRDAFAPYLNPPAPTLEKEKTCRERIDEEINRHKLDDYTDVEISILSQVKILADYIDALREKGKP